MRNFLLVETRRKLAGTAGAFLREFEIFSAGNKILSSNFAQKSLVFSAKKPVDGQRR
jgi:hypothetical protein